MEICSWEVIAKLIEKTNFMGFLPDYVAFSSDKAKHLKVAENDLFIAYTIFAAYPLRENLSLNAELLIRMAIELFKEKMSHLNFKINMVSLSQ